MKRNILIYVAFASALLLSVACNRNVEYKFDTYVTLYNTAYSVNETVTEIKVPVLVNNPSGSEVQVSVKLNGIEAEEGVDYELVSPAGGILTFSGETDSLEVVVGVKGQIGEFTGSKSLNLQVESLTAGVTAGVLNTALITILDLDHPLSAFIGTWTGTTFEEAYMGQNVTMNFNISADPEDFSKVVISTVDAMMSAVIGITKPINLESTVVLNEDGTGQIVIPNGQLCGFNNGDGEFMYMGIDAPDWGSATGYLDIVMNLNADGTMTVPNGFGIFDDKYIWAHYVGGYTLTKK